MNFRQIIKTIADTGEWMGCFGIFVIFAINLVDVVGAKLFQQPLRAAYEATGLVQLIVVVAAMTACFFAGRHIIVEFLVTLMPPLIRKGVNSFAAFTCATFFLLLSWKSYGYAVSLAKAGVISSSAHIPLYPFAYILAIFSFITVLFFLEDFRNAFRGGDKN